MLRNFDHVGVAGMIPATPRCTMRFAWGAFLAVMLCLSANVHAEPGPSPEELAIKKSKMQSLHQDIVLAEHNLAVGIEKNDLPRLMISVRFLEDRIAKKNLSDNPQHICVGAAISLLAASTSAGMYLNRSLTTVQIDDEKSIDLGPEDNDLLISYNNFRSEYKSKMSLCEAEIGRKETQRLLPEKLARTK